VRRVWRRGGAAIAIVASSINHVSAILAACPAGAVFSVASSTVSIFVATGERAVHEMGAGVLVSGREEEGMGDPNQGNR